MPTTSSYLSSLLPKLSNIEDFRMERNQLYPLNEILFLTVSAVISGCRYWEEIADFGEEKLTWLRKYLPFLQGTPSHDTLNRVFSHLDYTSFEHCFIDWVTEGLLLKEGTVINLDGKKLSRSATKQEQQLPRNQGGKGAVHLVEAWCSELQICLGQYYTDDKSNEIVSIPALIDLLELKGTVITIDAIGCQKKITEKIVKQEADYVIGLKANQKKLLHKVESCFGHSELKAVDSWDKGHGRIECRSCRVLPAHLIGEECLQGWTGLSTIIEISSYRQVVASGKVSREHKYYISSLQGTPERFNQIIRGHWAIENQLHWSLDVQFGEDFSTKRKDNAARNFGAVLRIATSLLKSNKDTVSLNRKMLKAARSDEYRETIIRL